MYVVSLLEFKIHHNLIPSTLKVGEGRFSDINVTCFIRTFRLHRIILMQSQFFKRAFRTNGQSEMTLDTDTDPRINMEGMEVRKSLFALELEIHTNVAPIGRVSRPV